VKDMLCDSVEVHTVKRSLERRVCNGIFYGKKYRWRPDSQIHLQ